MNSRPTLEWPVRWMLFCAVLLWAAFLLPNHYPPWTSFHGSAMAAVAFIPIGIWAALRGAPGVPGPVLLLWSMAAVPSAQWMAGLVSYRGDATVAMTYLLGAGSVCWAGASCRAVTNRAMSDARKSVSNDPAIFLAAALALAAIASFGMAVHQWLNLRLLGVLIEELPPGGRPYANLGQPNHLATLALMGLGGLLYLFERRSIGGAAVSSGVMVCLLTAVMTQSRTVALAGIGVLIFAWIKRRCVANRVRWMHVAGALLFYGLLISGWDRIQDALLIGGTPSVLDRTQENLRLALWHMELDAIGHAFWGGYGWNQAGMGQWVVALEHPSLRYFFDSAHNLILDLVLWNGVPIGLAFSLALAYFVWRIMVKIRDPGDFWLAAILIFVGSHALVEYPLSYAYFLLPSCFIIGYLVVGVDGASFFGRADKKEIFFRISVTLVTTALAILIIVDYIPWEAEWQKLRYEEQRIGTSSQAPLPRAVVLDQLQEFMEFSRAEASPGMSTSYIDWMHRVTVRYPYPASIFKYAKALYLNGQAGLAEEQLERLCRMALPKKCEQARSEWASVVKEAR